jgi:hypothetical protein
LADPRQPPNPLFQLVDPLDIRSATQDTSLLDGLALVRCACLDAILIVQRGAGQLLRKAFAA